MKQFLFTLALAMPVVSVSAADCYALIGYGNGTASGIKTRAEDKFFASALASGSYVVDGKSHPRQLGFGCSVFHPDVSVELSQWSGLEAFVDSHGTITLPGSPTQAFSARRAALIDGTSLMLRAKVPIAGQFSLTGGVGVLAGKQKLYVITSPAVNGTTYLEEKKNGWLPTLSLGLQWDMNTLVAWRLEYVRFNGDVKAVTIGLQWKFNVF